MARVRIDAGTLIVEMEGLNRLWALKSRLRIPMSHVRGATADPGVVRERRGVRTAGAYFPGIITAGTFRHEGERVFWDVRDPSGAVVIELDGDRYARLILQVADPRATVELVEGAVSRR